MFYAQTVEQISSLPSFTVFSFLSASLSFPPTTLTHNRLASIMQCHNRGSGEERKGEECEEMKRGREEGCRLGRSDAVEAWIAGKGKTEESR